MNRDIVLVSVVFIVNVWGVCFGKQLDHHPYRSVAHCRILQLLLFYNNFPELSSRLSDPSLTKRPLALLSSQQIPISLEQSLKSGLSGRHWLQPLGRDGQVSYYIVTLVWHNPLILLLDAILMILLSNLILRYSLPDFDVSQWKRPDPIYFAD